jgi:hypothetical protein
VRTALFLLLLAASPALCGLAAHVLQSGGLVNVTLVLDSAPGGLSGYTIVVMPSGAEIAGVYFPQWARLSDWSGGVIKAADLDDKVRPGAANVTLATIALRARQNATLRVVARIDDDGGNTHYETAAVQVVRQSPMPSAPMTAVAERPYIHPVTYVAIAVAVATAVLALYLATRRR